MKFRMLMGLLTGIIVGLIVILGTQVEGFFLTKMLNQYEFRSYDARMKIHARKTETASIDSIVVIDIDQNSIQDLGNYKDWPQAYHGQLIDVVASGQPKAIIFDIIFDPENKIDHELISDLVLNRALTDTALIRRGEDYLKINDPDHFVRSTQASENIFHSLVFENSDSINFLYKMESEPPGYNFGRHLIQIPREQAIHLPTGERLGNTFVELLSAASGAGSANFPQDADGITRRAPTAIYFKGPGHVYPSLPMAAAMHTLGIPGNGFDYDFENHVLTLKDTSGSVVREIPIDDQGRMYVNYVGYFKTFYYLPYSYCFDADLLQPAYWKNRIAIVGSSLPGLMDLKNTPVQESFSGVEIQANVLYSLMNSEFIRVVPNNINNLVVITLCAIMGFLTTLMRRPIFSIPAMVIIVILWIIFVYSRFWYTLEIWEIVRPIVGITVTFVSAFLYNYFINEKNRRFLKATFRTYISPTLIDQMYTDKQVPSLGGDEGYQTAFFSDIQDFSKFSEALPASELVELLNEYLTELTDVLLKNNGTLDKYIGDAIVAFYGAPVPVEKHEYYACITALQMQSRLNELREKWKSEGDRWPVSVHEMRCRIGINSGKMVTGNMGSSTRMNYTMMGDIVNIAARLESSAKYYGVYIQVGENTYEAVKNDFEWRFLDYVCVKGKTVPINVYELLAEKGQLDENAIRLQSKYQDGIDLFHDQKWDEAISAFKESEVDEIDYPGRLTNPSKMRIERCELMKKYPPGPGWDKVWYFSQK